MSGAQRVYRLALRVPMGRALEMHTVRAALRTDWEQQAHCAALQRWLGDGRVGWLEVLAGDEWRRLDLAHVALQCRRAVAAPAARAGRRGVKRLRPA